MTPPILFDRAQLRKRRARTAPRFTQHDFLHREAAQGIIESLNFIARGFPTIVELGAHTGALSDYLRTRPGTAQYIACDLTPAVLRPLNAIRVCADEERLPFAENSVDAVVSVLSMHWINDLPGSLAQIHRMLKPDGMFIAVLPGGETLRELRAALAHAETARYGGITPRVAPFIDVRDAGALLQRAGFALPVADSDTLSVTYPHFFALTDDLRGAAQSNMLHQRAPYTSRALFADAAQYYADHYRNGEGQITATVELVTLTGWKPDASQQQPAKRGSGNVSLAKILQ